MTKKNTTYISSLAIKRIATAAGKEDELRQSLEQQLKQHGIDPSVAYNKLPAGDAGKAEIVARLVSLARGHGLVVQAPDIALDKGGTIKVVTPASMPTLQSGHDQM
jgi:hypothetical protein